jgi:4-amino-4-deoxychorismate lyase
MILVNGEQKDSIAISDRGLQYGDGLFETIEVKNGRPVFYKLHLTRLSAGCKKLKIPFPDPELLIDEARFIIQHSSSAILKLIITRGSGGRGYQQPVEIQPTRILSLHPFPDYPDTYKQQGINARFCQQRLGHNPELAGMKHLNRLEQVMARSEWQDHTIQEGLMLDINDHVIEGTMTNLFLVKKNVLHTPMLNMCGVNGILRHIIIENAVNQGINITELTLNKEDVLAADELFVTNSIIGVWPVKTLEHRKYPIGPLSIRFAEWLNDCKQKDLCA